MSDTQTQNNKEEFQYPKEFEIAVSQIFVNVPHYVLGNKKDYSAKVLRNDDAVKLDISFHVKDDSEDIAEVSQQIFNFIEFVNNQKLEGIVFDYDNGIMTFDNAGYVVAALQEYIDQNPDGLDEETLDGLDDMLMKAFQDHVPELIHLDNNEPDFKYPRCADAIVSGFYSYRAYKDYENFGIAYKELKDKSHRIQFVCPNMKGEDFPDPDDVGKLEEIYDELSALASSGVSVKLTNNRQIVEVTSSHPLKTYELIESIYEENGMRGQEDVLKQWDNDVLLDRLLGASKQKILSDDMLDQNPSDYERLKKSILANYYRKMAIAGLDNIGEYASDDGDELRIVPMGVFNSISDLAMHAAISSNANCYCSLDEIESIIRLELKLPTTASQKKYALH